MRSLGVQSENRKAIVFCEGQLGEVDGKTANGLVRSSAYFDICGVIDARFSGQTADKVISGGMPVPIFDSLSEAMAQNNHVGWSIYGKAPLGGRLPDSDKPYIKEALSLGLNVVSGLMHFLSEDEAFTKDHDPSMLYDIRKPPAIEKQHIFSGEVSSVGAKRILIAGTDCAQGKRLDSYHKCIASEPRGLFKEPLK